MGSGSLAVKNFMKSLPIGKRLRDIYQKRAFTKENAQKAFQMYYGSESGLDADKTVADMLREAKKYSFGFDEYHMFHFEGMPFEERRTYVSDRERISYCERMNNMRNMIVFDDKGKTYAKYGKYYHRDLLEFFGGGAEQFAQFIKKHPRFIVKPFDGSCGIGIKIVDSEGKKAKEVLEGLYKEYVKGFVIEELIIQHPEMARLHPESVNTLRVPTINYGDHVDIIHPILRIGRGDAIVDNGGSGGICCGIDPKTGITFSASDENGNDYITHPDTGVSLVGYTVPYWEEAKELVKELAGILPDNHYTGWDLALTKDGWIMQEANDRGTFILFQITTKKGFKSEIEEIVKKLGV